MSSNILFAPGPGLRPGLRPSLRPGLRPGALFPGPGIISPPGAFRPSYGLSWASWSLSRSSRLAMFLILFQVLQAIQKGNKKSNTIFLFNFDFYFRKKQGSSC